MSDDGPPRPLTVATVGSAAVGLVATVADVVFDTPWPLDTVGGVLIVAGVLALAWRKRREGANAAAATLVGTALCALASYADDFGVSLPGGLLRGALLLVGVGFVLVGAREHYTGRGA
ncbi:hypothetical protein MBEHAL_0112 [Halarchaeum acidiphilum MH1-52-1]|uniref:Uncharacterized protein n=1 Tax=Halarchaeum acidiphilum MH1-52-1 TaxID=1261545 RepID=U2YRL9_9EURY|nr:hypothetical protein [Halarchaeum acidiphilum]GAD51352.1 hypothetical protein MBEHAL_0112 [Halarchaeum acidiphilum MH1-52-1]